MPDERRSVAPWVGACAAAEAIGIGAAAAAARAADSVAAQPGRWAGATTALAVIVAGGLVEGSALGWFQGRVLRRRLPRLSLGRYVLATVLVAGLGWAVASAPPVLASGGAGAAPPPLLLVLLGAAGIGLLLGAVLGGAQALVLRGAAERPGRWVLANSLAWPPAMIVIFLGATRPGATWSLAAVVALGAGTGAVAGVVVGVVTGRFLPVPRAQHAGPGRQAEGRPAGPVSAMIEGSDG
jgi:hypothetical protein